jgi:magnesium chelatase subunit H
MEAGRRIDVATSILSTKNVVYIVAAPLLIQDLRRYCTMSFVYVAQCIMEYCLCMH